MGRPTYEIGRYLGKVTNQALGESKGEKRTPQFVLSFEVMGRINPADPDGDLIACPRLERSLFIYITDKTIDFVTRDLESLGYDKASFRFLSLNVAGAHDFRGQEIEVYCNHEPYKNEPHEKWSISRGGGIVVAPLDDKGVRQLDNLFGKQLKDSAAKATKRPKPVDTVKPAYEEAAAMAGTPAGPPDEDIPF